MTPDELLDRVEAGEDAAALLARPVPGVGESYFERVRIACATDPARAARLAGAWRAFARRGDAPALAWRAKGAGDRLASRWLASARAFARAGELAADLRDRLAFRIGGVDGLAKAGRVEEAVALGRELAAGLDALREPGLAARARLNAANALLNAERGPEARRLYEAAIPAFAAQGWRMEEAMARLGLSSTHLYGGDPATAGREAEGARAIAAAEGFDHLAALAGLNLAHVALVSGRADEAFAALVALRAEFDSGTADAARAEEFVGDACLALNLREEAAEAYAAALAQADALPALDVAHVLLGSGEASGSDAHLARAEARYRALGNRAWGSAATSLRAARAEDPVAAVRLARRAVAEAKGSPYHEALALLTLAEANLRHGIDPRGELNRAARIVRRYGYRRFAWRVHALRARASARPLPHYRRMLAEIVRERLAATSVAARASVMRDKTDALGAYLARLLSRPTPARVAEAREAVRLTRAAALLDEIVAGVRLDDARRARLDALRAEVARDAALEPAPDARAAGTAPVPSRRAWTEAGHVLGALGVAVPPLGPGDGVVMVEGAGRLWALERDRATPLPLSTRELEEALRWLRFEVQAPTAHRDAPAGEADKLLERLREGLVSPWHAGGRSRRVCPDGPLWRVPWNALFPPGDEPTVLLHPAFAGGERVGPLDRVAVWLDAPTDLPHAPREAETVLARFPGARVLRTRAEIVASLDERWDLIHVVGHARHHGGNPMFSALALPDGPLYAAEIARSGLRAGLVVLSACETGTLSGAVRTEPDGLVRAFLARGATGVLASLWPLDDEAAARFGDAFYADLRPGADLPRAVGNARQSVRAWRSHPYFWSSLSLFGGSLS